MKKILFIALLAISALGHAQIIEVPLEERIRQSAYIFEGKVLKKTSLRDAGNTHIYTSNIIQVGKVFKGKKLKGTVEVITEGGIVDSSMEEVSPALRLTEAGLGIFMCNPSQVRFSVPMSSGSSLRLTSYADEQGFIVYDPVSGTASDPFTNYGSVHKNLHPLIKNLIKDKDKQDDAQSLLPETGITSQAVAAASVVSFTPATITAGTRSVLSIRGSGFGATQGTGRVTFSNADNGGNTIDVAPLSTQYHLWTDTLIQVEVPSGAGTGPFRVTTSAGVTYTSPASLVVRYNITNITYNNLPYIAHLVNQNGSGGYSWQMNTTFYNNTGARAAFTRALQTWRCGTHVNFSLGATTSNNTAARDGIIVIRFDVGSELPAGVLGRCVSYYNGCSSGSTISWYVSEFDITFDDATNWNYSTAAPAFSQYDFESVAVHELGHGQQLGHVINTADVMHYAIANGQTRRSLNTDDLNGGQYVMSLSTASGACGYGPMIPLTASNCAARIASTYSNPADNNHWIISNPFDQEASVTIQTDIATPLNLYLSDMQGRMVWKTENKETNSEIHFGNELPSGIYILYAEYGAEKKAIKIVKK